MNIYYIIGIFILILGAAAYYFYYYANKPKEFADLVKRAGINHQDTDYELLDSDGKKSVLLFMISSKIFGIKPNFSSVIEFYKEINDLDKLLSIMVKLKKVDIEVTVNEVKKIIKATPETDKFIEAWVDQINSELDLSFDLLISHTKAGNDPRKLIEIGIQARRANLDITLNDFIAEGFDNKEIEILVHALIRSKKANIYLEEEQRFSLNRIMLKDYQSSFKITKSFILELHKLKRDINLFVNIMIRAHEAGLILNLSLLDIFSLSDQEFDSLVNNLIKAQRAGIYIDQEDLIHQNISGNDINKLVSSIIAAKKANLDIQFSELMEYHVHTAGDVSKFVNALIIARNAGLPITKESLIEHTFKNCDLVDYVSAIKTVSSNPDYGISVDQVEGHYAKAGKVTHVIASVLAAKAKNLKMDFNLASRIDLTPNLGLAEALKWATIPRIIEVQPALTVVTKEGIQITPKINVTLRGRIELIFSGYREDLLFSRINDSVVMEIEGRNSHEDVLEELPHISRKVLRKLLASQSAHDVSELSTETDIAEDNKRQSDLNQHCAYDILDLNIYDILIGKNIKAELEKEEAEIEAHIHHIHAQADLVKAEAELRKAMVEAYRGGDIPNFNELHKDSLFREKKGDSAH